MKLCPLPAGHDSGSVVCVGTAGCLFPSQTETSLCPRLAVQTWSLSGPWFCSVGPRQRPATWCSSSWRETGRIRRRRPTPATLFRVADQTSPEDDQSTHQPPPPPPLPPCVLLLDFTHNSPTNRLFVLVEFRVHKWVVGENGVLKPKRVNPNVYQPPSLKDHQETATTEQSDKLSSVRETTKQIQAAQEEEEEEEEEEEDKTKATTEESNRGSN
ncbi:hypothetical protein INR49_017881 [Caranx melampygus]|nr:hypothetical protein INR49_017881 [Caranx melampygus]